MTEKLSAKTNAKTTSTRVSGREVSMKESTPSRSKPARDNGFLEGSDCKEFEAAAVLASNSPSAIVAMGTFPLSLIALARSAAAGKLSCQS
jgi:hypothetical protein